MARYLDLTQSSLRNWVKQAEARRSPKGPDPPSPLDE
ncbi:MAG: hypothetical protein HOP15_14925 [Planctomycetes bacterium]|nr:hypothetical protein [Planctomycetota bacterium]